MLEAVDDGAITEKHKIVVLPILPKAVHSE